jgi:hypothetical protein
MQEAKTVRNARSNGCAGPHISFLVLPVKQVILILAVSIAGCCSMQGRPVPGAS